MKKMKRARPAGLFRWRRRLGIFDNAAQVAEELHVRHRLSVEDSWRLVIAVKRDLGGKATDPRVLWRECRARLGDVSKRHSARQKFPGRPGSFCRVLLASRIAGSRRPRLVSVRRS